MKTRTKYILALLMALPLLGCSLGSGKQALMIQQYALEYPSPRLPALDPLNEVLRVDRFDVAQIFKTNKIVYRENSYNYNDYVYHRWRANPGDMVGDYLLRDLRQSGLFKAVFSYRDPDDISLLLKGGVGEFFEADEKDVRNAVLAISLTLMDLSQEEMSGRVLWQRNYRLEEPVVEQSMQGLVHAMSSAMEKLSRQLLGDLYSAIKNRSKPQGGK